MRKTSSKSQQDPNQNFEATNNKGGIAPSVSWSLKSVNRNSRSSEDTKVLETIVESRTS